MVRSELRQHGTNSRVIGGGSVALVDQGLEPGIAHIAGDAR